MHDTPANQSVYPQSGAQKPELGFPLAMLVALISLSTGAVFRWALGPCRGKHTGEQALFRTLMPHLDAEDIVLADRYHCNCSAMVNKEIAVYVLAYNLMCALMTRAGAAAHVLARALSFKATLQLLLAFQQHLRLSAARRATIMTAHLLGAISLLQLPIRPGRVEPHAIKRRPKAHQLLTVPRRIAREAILRARHVLA